MSGVRRSNYQSRKGKSPAAAKKDMFEEATKNLLEIMKDGVMPWSKGRAESLGAAMPTNFNTGKRYRGVNIINLMCISALNNFNSNFFMTYNQALNVAGLKRPSGKQQKDQDVMAAFTEKMPLSGQKAVGHVTYWGNVTKDKDGKPWFKIENGKKRTNPTPDEVKAEKLQQFWFLRDTAVFAFEQMSHVPEAWLEKRNMIEQTINRDVINNTQDKNLAESVKKLVKQLGVEVIHDATTDTPYYAPGRDKIVMPPVNMFESDARYYHSLLHEMIHATGAATRLDRDSLRDYSLADENRAYEELVAELGGVFMAIEIGIKPTPSDNLMNHASYIKGWSKLLTDDLASGNCTVLNRASKDAEKAVEFLMQAPELKRDRDAERKQDMKKQMETSTLEP